MILKPVSLCLGSAPDAEERTERSPQGDGRQSQHLPLGQVLPTQPHPHPHMLIRPHPETLTWSHVWHPDPLSSLPFVPRLPGVPIVRTGVPWHMVSMLPLLPGPRLQGLQLRPIGPTQDTSGVRRSPRGPGELQMKVQGILAVSLWHPLGTVSHYPTEPRITGTGPCPALCEGLRLSPGCWPKVSPPGTQDLHDH